LTDFHFIRAYPTTIQQNGRTLTGRLVPYNVATDVLDELPDGKLDVYREGFRPGAFGPQVNTKEKGIVNRIGLIHRHEGGLGYLGPFVALREEADGLWGDVTVLPTRADDVATLLNAGVSELSIEFRLPRNDHTVEQDGVRWRTRAHLDQVALEPRGAYRQAQVLQYRAEQDQLAKEAAEAEHERQAAEAAAELAAAEALERRARWDAMVGRIDGEQVKQAEMIRTYGAVRPGGLGSIRQ